MKSSGKYYLFLLLLALQCLVAVSLFGGSGEDEYDEYDEKEEDRDHQPATVPLNTCTPVQQKAGVEWVMSEWSWERGWGEQTPRALIVLAVAGLPGLTTGQVRQMELQLDVEITTMLLRNHSHPLHRTDLVLYVQALLAMGRNPRDFYGRDLVALLKQGYPNHPGLLLGLCDARAVDHYHAQVAQNLLQGYLRTKDIDHLALTLKAASCLKSLDLEIDQKILRSVQEYLISLQLPNGSFGNLYTTSLIVQALASTTLEWNLKGALKYLDAHSFQSPNMVLAYHILMAEHSTKYPFVKEIHPDLHIDPVMPKRDDGIFVQYSVKPAQRPDIYFTIAVKMPRNATFFDVMQVSQIHDSKFKFESYVDKSQRHHVYSISGVPNDAEGNMYWHLCLQRNVNHQLHTYDLRSVNASLTEVKLVENDHFIYWFRDTGCDHSSQRPIY